MTEFFRVPTDQAPIRDQSRRWADFAEPRPFTAETLYGVEFGKGELANCLLDTCIRLDWEDLQCFEKVDCQFQRWGVTFSNAIALRPSNPAYPAYSGVMVLMGAPKSGCMEVTFLHPVRFVSGFVTASRRTVLTAFDRNNRAIVQTESSGANLANSDSHHSPNVRLSLNMPNIYRLTFNVFDGQLTLDDFCFGF
ncbi:MAG: hypothetical protein HC865_22700 [Cyanobacteria bacterium RU_5_0]|nr:hypothetical protein [Cyanobacteria bacterium RU_5_0]